MLGSRSINKYTSSIYVHGSWPEPWGENAELSPYEFHDFFDQGRKCWLSLFFSFHFSILPILYLLATVAYLCRQLSSIIFTARQAHVSRWHSLYFTQHFLLSLIILHRSIVDTYASYVYLRVLHRFSSTKCRVYRWARPICLTGSPTRSPHRW